MKKLLIIQPVHDKAMEVLKDRPDIAAELVMDDSEENLLRHIADADAMTVRMTELSERLLSAAPRLKVISRHGVGYDNIPVDFCTSRGIPVTLVGPVNSISVAEHTLFLMLSVARLGVEMDSAVREGLFSARGKVRYVELHGKTLLVIGYGNIGRRVAERAKAIGLNICVYDPHLTGSLDEGMTLIEDLDDGLRRADVVTLHVPLTAETKGMIGARELSLLPPKAIVLNASRGGLLDEAALLEAVRSGALHGAGLDTFEQEPLPADSPLIGERRIVLSPHSASLTEETLIAMGMKTIENALAGIDGTLDPDLVVNRQVLETSAQSPS